MARRRPLMVLGCTSDAGKSLVVTALCAWFRRQGVRVAPFKAQNMSNNARVVDGGEIGVAQWLQARAAGVTPDVRMNPVLLKPEADTGAQVIVNGEARRDLTHMPWRERPAHLWPAMQRAFDDLAGEVELVVLEGAGSPAETNLPDLVNNSMIAHADAAGLLVSDIDRGGSFAHLFGTWSLVPDATRERLLGFALNKFRGDASLLAPAPEDLAARTGMAHLGTLPMLEHELPDEEGATVRGRAPEGAPRVVVPRLPYGSNLDELHLLAHAVQLSIVRTPAELTGADLVLLPGSKHVAADLRWLRERGLADAIRRHHAAGGAVLGICGGCQMVGTQVHDPRGVESADRRSEAGLGLLPIETELGAKKVVRRVEVTLPELPGRWSRLTGARTEGYEIRFGATSATEAGFEAPPCFASETVLATPVHGLLEDPDVLERLFGVRPEPVLERAFAHLADAVDQAFDTERLWRWVSART